MKTIFKSFFILPFLLTNCNKNVDVNKEIIIKADTLCVLPSEIIHIEIENKDDIQSLGKTKWFVNNEEIILNNNQFELDYKTESREKKYDIQVIVEDNDKSYYSNILSCYSSSNEKIIKTIYEYIDKWNFKPAIAVSIYSDKLTYSMYNGLFSLSTNVETTNDNYFNIFSITKSFTAYSILKLVEQNKISLNDELKSFFPELNPVFFNLDTTIIELLSHRSGIADYIYNVNLFLNNPFNYSTWNPYKILDFVNEPVSERGIYNYSSTNYILLGLIIEKITNKKYNEYIKEMILNVYNLDNTYFLPQDDIDYSLINHPHIYPNTFFEYSGDGENPIDLTTVVSNVLELYGKCSYSAGGAISKGMDISKWGYNLFSSNGNVEKNIKDLFLNSIKDFTKEQVNEVYGYGIRKLFYNDTSFIGSYGRSVGNENLMFYNEEKDFCVGILSSSNMKKDNTPNIDELMFNLYEII